MVTTLNPNLKIGTIMSNSINPEKFKQIVSDLADASGFEHMLLLATDGNKAVIVGEGDGDAIKTLIMDAFLSVIVGIDPSDVKLKGKSESREEAVQKAFTHFINDLKH